VNPRFPVHLLGGPLHDREITVRTIGPKQQAPRFLCVDKHPYEFARGYLSSAEYVYMWQPAVKEQVREHRGLTPEQRQELKLKVDREVRRRHRKEPRIEIRYRKKKATR
jgi:hypothetical protein